MRIQKIIQFPSIVLILGVITLCGCKKEETYISHGHLITNGNVESGTLTPNGWYHTLDQEDFNFSWTDLESSSPTKSLSISTSFGHLNFVTWSQTISNDLPLGHKLTLKAKIKCNLTGDGVAIVIRGDDTVLPSGVAELFESTQNRFSISGTNDWHDWAIMSSALSNTIKSITVYLLYLPATKGEVYFDDIDLYATYK